MLGAFETSLRRGVSPSLERKAHLHKGCCGSLHGHGVKKERPSKELPSMSRSCSLTPFDHQGVGAGSGSGSSDNDSNEYARHSLSPTGKGRVPDLLLTLQQRRSASTDYGMMSASFHAGQLPNNKNRSSSLTHSEVANRLYSSPTKSTSAKRASAAGGQGFRSKSSPTGGGGSSGGTYSDCSGSSGDHKEVNFAQSLTPTPDERRRESLIRGVSDDDLATMEELRCKQRSPRSPTHRRNSPSPGPKVRVYNVDQRGRRSSGSSSSSLSPPASPSPTNLPLGQLTRSVSNRPWSNSSKTTTSSNLSARRTKSSGASTPRLAAKRASNAYAFGSSTSRFEAGAEKKPPPPLTKT